MKFATVLLLLGLVAVAQAGRTLPSARKLLDEGYYIDGHYGPIDYHEYGPLYYSFPFDEAKVAYANADGHAQGDGAVAYTESIGKTISDFGSASKSGSIAANDYDYFGLGLAKGGAFGDYTYTKSYTDANAYTDSASASASSGSASCTGDGCGKKKDIIGPY